MRRHRAHRIALTVGGIAATTGSAQAATVQPAPRVTVKDASGNRAVVMNRTGDRLVVKVTAATAPAGP